LQKKEKNPPRGPHQIGQQRWGKERKEKPLFQRKRGGGRKNLLALADRGGRREILYPNGEGRGKVTESSVRRKKKLRKGKGKRLLDRRG